MLEPLCNHVGNDMSSDVLLCHQDSIVEGRARGFDVHDEGADVLFVVRYRGQLHAWRNDCPHNRAPMAWQRDEYMNAAGTHIACHAHGALFAPDSGLCVRGPCIGQSLRREALFVDPNGNVYWRNLIQ